MNDGNMYVQCAKCVTTTILLMPSPGRHTGHADPHWKRYHKNSKMCTAPISFLHGGLDPL